MLSGDSLRVISEQTNLMHKLIEISSYFRVILACRVSPKQKQELVYQYKLYNPEVVTLAVGDGANDVNMITEANIGIGIKGVEGGFILLLLFIIGIGSQAARASDYAI